MKELTPLEKYNFLAAAKKDQKIGLVFPYVKGENSPMGAARIKVTSVFPNFKIEVEEADLAENVNFKGSCEKGAAGIIDILEQWMSAPSSSSIMVWGPWHTIIIIPM